MGSVYEYCREVMWVQYMNTVGRGGHVGSVYEYCREVMWVQYMNTVGRSCGFSI